MEPCKGRGRCIPGFFRCPRGFTLVELMVVVTLLGIVSAAAVPCFRTVLARYELAAAARQLAGDIRECEQLARGWRAEGGKEELDHFEVRFNSSADSYSFGLTSEKFKTVKLPAGVELVYTNFPSNILILNLKGTPKGNGGTVSLRSRVTGDYLYVVVAVLSGRVRVSETEPGKEEITN